MERIMELIYYWINKKKCIHEQGFCFSPEYNISMLKVEQGKYELKISRKKENNVFLSDVISNITVLVGDNGAGKTTLLKELWSLRCYPCENEDREEYQEFNKNENEKNKNLIILKKDDGQLYLYTNIYQKNIQIQGEIIKSIFYLSDYSSIASEFIRTSGEYFGFTKIYISNSYFDDLNGMSTNGKLDELAITPARLFFISSAFFEFICPDKTYNEKVNDFGRYSNWLKQNKDPDEFQQICDLMFYNFLIDEDFISDYEGFVQTQIRVNIYLAFTRIERAKMDGKIQESLWDIVKPVLDILHSKCIVDKAKDDLGYVLKTNFIFEWVLENGLEMLSTDDDIEAIYTKIVSVLGTKDISAATISDKELDADFILMCGDFFYQGKTDESRIKACGDYIHKIISSAGCDKSSVYMTPGNHDLVRSNERNHLLSYYTNINYETGKKKTEVEHELDANAFKNLNNGSPDSFLGYAKLYKKITGKVFKGNHECIEKDSYRILNINTSILAGSAYDEGNLSVYCGPLLEECKKIKNDDKINIAFMHHGVEFLKKTERRKFEQLMESHYIDIVFSGHSHDIGIRTYDHTGNRMRQFTCGGPLKDGYNKPSFYYCIYDSDTHELKCYLYTYNDEIQDWNLANTERAFKDGKCSFILPRFQKKSKYFDTTRDRELDGIFRMII